MKNIILSLLVFIPSLSFAFDWQSHRGARGLYPENTTGAMLEALKYPINTLELDVVVTADKKVIVSHEPWMSDEICLDPDGKSFEGKKYNISKMSLKDVQEFDCGSKPHPRFPRQKNIKEHKPELSTLLKTTEASIKSLGKKINYSIEIKSTIEDEMQDYQPTADIFAQLVMEVIKKHLPPDRVMIQSFDWRVLRYLNRSYPQYKTVALIEGKFNARSALLKLGFTPTVFSPYYEYLTKDDVEYFHKEKILVIPWTVNDKESMKKLIEMKVDGIITDYPDLIEPSAQ
jgi:glycerophosphoryl diester phosphodiesterase